MDPITRLNAALQGRYAIERELGEGGMATVCFVGSTPQAVLGTIIAGMPEAVTQHGKTVPANIEATINKALETVPTDGPPASSGTEIRLTGLEGKGAARGGGARCEVQAGVVGWRGEVTRFSEG